MTQHYHVLLPRLILVREESPAERGFDTKNRKDISTDELAADPLRVTAAGEIDVLWPVRADSFKRRGLSAKVKEVCGRNLIAHDADFQRLLPNRDQPVRIFERQRSQQHGIDRAEDCSIYTNPERQSQKRNRRRPRPLQQAPESVANIRENRFNDPYHPWLKLTRNEAP